MSRLQYWSSPLKGYTCCRGKAILFLFQFWLIHLSNGVHLTNTISYTAIDLAKSAGMDDDDISAAIPVTEEEGLLLQATDDGTIKDSQQKYSQDFLNKNEIPSILEVSKSSSVPVLPLCCSTEGDDTARYQCNSESLEHLQGSENVVKRKWTAPAKLVSTKEATSFKLVKSVLSCHYAAFAASISLTADASDAHHFYPDGNLKYENEFYRIDEYCISSIRKEKVYLQICQANCTDPTSPCIQKCCGLDEVYSFGYDDYPAGCQPISRDFDYSDGSANGESFDNRSLTKWSPILYHDLSSRLSNSEVSNLRPHYILNYPSNFKQKCKSKKTTVFPFGSKVSDYLTMVTGKPFKNLQFKMRKDGWLLYPFRDSKGNEIPVVNRILNYCIDGAQHYGEMTEYANEESQSVLFLCSGGVDEAFEDHVVLPESMEVEKYSNNGEVSSSNSGSQEAISEERETKKSSKGPSSVEIYKRTRQRPHILYQLFHFNSPPRPANIIPYNGQKLAKIKKRKPSIINLFPNHPNRTKIVTKKRIKKPKYQLPVCCPFPGDVIDDIQTHHCNNRMVDLTFKASKNSKITLKPIWNSPSWAMTSGQEAVFTLDTRPVSCGFGEFKLQEFIHNFELNADSLNSSAGPIESGILSNGYLKIKNEFYRPEEFCLNGVSPRIIEVLVCKPNSASKLTPYIPKCCALDESYSLGLDSGYRGCLPLSDEDPRFHPTFFRNMQYPVKDEDQHKIKPHFIQRFPPTFQHLCYRGITLAFPFSESIAAQLNPESSETGPTFKNLLFRFRSDGKLLYSIPNENGESSLTSVFDRKEFCVDLVTDYGIDEPLINHENQTILFICASQPNQQDENYR